MKTIKIDENALEILANFKYAGSYKSYSETIKQLKRYCEHLLFYKQKYMEEHNEK